MCHFIYVTDIEIHLYSHIIILYTHHIKYICISSVQAVLCIDTYIFNACGPLIICHHLLLCCIIRAMTYTLISTLLICQINMNVFFFNQFSRRILRDYGFIEKSYRYKTGRKKKLTAMTVIVFKYTRSRYFNSLFL